MESKGLFDESESLSLHLLRICATLFIFLCHAFALAGSWIAQFFNVGVEIFFMLSGYLYANRKINHPLQWIGKRLKKLMIPLDIFLLVVLICHMISGVAEPFWVWIINLLPIKGWWGEEISGCGHLWFIAHIFICYIFTPLFDWIRSSHPRIHNVFGLSFLILLMLSRLLAFTPVPYSFYAIGGSLFVYCIGYYLLPLLLKSKKSIQWILFSLLVVLSLIVRLATHRFLDNTPWYTLSNGFTHPLLGLGLIGIIYQTGKILFMSPSPCIKCFIQGVSGRTYEFYLVHNLFLSGVYTVTLSGHVWLNVFIAFLLSCVCAFVLSTIAGLLSKAVSHRKAHA